MKRNTHLPLALSFIGAVCATQSGAQTILTTDFSEVSLGSESFYTVAQTDTPVTFESNGVSFPHTTPSWGGFSEFTVSNQTDVTTPGFGNPASAYTGTGSGDANYGVAYANGPLALDFTQGGVAPLSIDITNTTYAALSMLQGDDFAKQFGGVSGDDPDYFLLSITGLDALDQETGTVDFYLADFRASDNSLDYIVDSWETVDLTSLGDSVMSLSFALESSDVGGFGMNTPSYFAFDNLSFSAVPEPQTYAAFLGALALGFVAWRRRKA